ncbi:hypothetical protein QF049_002863 [Paenibacillus sp. W4I10]|uniref:discoidin domain-containing protein n=1 Tax=Paenibacillus sp. W4I10 TaxID=3042298 RepID=UPI0027801E8D|nr:discoidin domain-containing protein [Paenibacillus sp. W4I10]MDQ0721602.1 hypothetical protein [Paenibacillus sp. W4I10]
MAAVGDQLTTPESGWRRYDDTHVGLKYTGSWTTPSPSNIGYYGGSIRVTSRAVDNNYVTFSFYGTKLRIISDFYEHRHSNNAITIDGVTETYSAFRAVGSPSLQQSIVYEKTGLPLAFHTVTIATGHNRINFTLDAIDIDETGYLSGYALTATESGWKRYDDSHPFVVPSGNFARNSTDTNFHNTSAIFIQDATGEIKINFYGTRFRLIGAKNTNRSTNVEVLIDGVLDQSFSQNGALLYKSLDYERSGLSLGNHSIIIKGNGLYGFDAIDIDDNGQLIASIGSRLPTPDEWWKRYDDNNSAINYEGVGWISATGDPNTYAGTAHYTSLNGASSNRIKFNFYGTKLRIIDLYWTNRVNNVTIEIDGKFSTWNPNNSANKYQVLVFEVSGLTKGLHEVKLSTTSSSGTFSLDAIDIDLDGRLFHPDEVTSVTELEIGKRIRCHYQTSVANNVGLFSGLGEQSSDLIPVSSSATPNGDFYFIMVEDGEGRKLLVADRNIQHSISWDSINANGMASGGGAPISLLKTKEIATSIRLLTGGINATDKDNEWDKYIVNSTLNGEISAGSNFVWNWSGAASWASTTNTGGSANRTGRGGTGGNVGASGYNPTSYVGAATATGFRPLMEIEILPMFRSLIKHNAEYKRFKLGSSKVDKTLIITPLMTSNTTPSGVTSASSIYNSSYEAWRAFNGGATGTEDCWASSAGSPSGHLAYKFNDITTLSMYSITSRDASDLGSAPKDWTFQGSNDGINWSVIHTVSNSTGWSQKETRQFVLDKEYSYFNYRLNITSNNGLNYTTVGELELIKKSIIDAIPSEWSIISVTLPSESSFINDGMDDLSVFDRKKEDLIQIMNANGSLGSGKLFKGSIDLKKYIEITNVSVK